METSPSFWTEFWLRQAFQQHFLFLIIIINLVFAWGHCPALHSPHSDAACCCVVAMFCPRVSCFLVTSEAIYIHWALRYEKHCENKRKKKKEQPSFFFFFLVGGWLSECREGLLFFTPKHGSEALVLINLPLIFFLEVNMSRDVRIREFGKIV